MKKTGKKGYTPKSSHSKKHQYNTSISNEKSDNQYLSKYFKLKSKK